MTRRRALRNLDEDIRDHIERETQDNLDRGMTPEEARSAALRKFGKVALILEDTRSVWHPVWLQQFAQDVRYGMRMLRRDPAFTLVLALTLALGIGMTTAVFSVVNAVLLRPLPYPDPERLVWITDYNPMLKAELVSGADYLDWKNQTKSFDEVVAYSYNQQTLATAEGAERQWFARVTSNFWQISGARAALGKLFTDGARDAVVISYALFERRFGSDPHVVGKVVKLDGRPFTVVGVLPPNFRFLLPQALRIFVRRGPSSNDIDAYLLNSIGNESRSGAHSIQLVAARLKRGVSLESARAELEGLRARITRENPSGNYDLQRLRITPLTEKLIGDSRPALLILLGAVGFVLLIACANITSLLLARSASRRKEIAIRTAIGAGRSRIVRQFLGESMALALLGGAGGLVLARVAILALGRFAPQAIPRLAEVNLDWRAGLCALCGTLVAGIFFGLSSALSLWRSGAAGDLKLGGRMSSTGSPGLSYRRLLVAGEMALAIVLLTGAGLLMRSFWRITAHPSGFDPERTLMTQIVLTEPHYETQTQQVLYFQNALDRIQSLPGVSGAGIVNTVARGPIRREGEVFRLSAQTPSGSYNAVSAGFGRTLGLRLIRGRWLTDHEPSHSVLINESYARVMFANTDPIGKRIVVPGMAPPPQDTPCTIVGVVSDLKYTRLDADPEPEVYLPYLQTTDIRVATMLVRTATDASRIAPEIRTLLTELDRAQPPGEMKTLEKSLAESILPRRFNLFLLATFAAAALMLALVGIYGVIAYSVSQRTHEIGVRAALGASAGEIVRMMVRQGMAIAVPGIATGVAAAFGLTRLMEGLLFEIKPGDPATFGSVTVLLAVTALVASWFPARRAAQVDPMVVLRLE